MVHLVVHLPREALLREPVTFRCIYLIKKNLKTYKRYVTNKTRLESSIVGAYIIVEAIIFCLIYFNGMETCFNQAEQNVDVGHN